MNETYITLGMLAQVSGVHHDVFDTELRPAYRAGIGMMLSAMPQAAVLKSQYVEGLALAAFKQEGQAPNVAAAELGFKGDYVLGYGRYEVMGMQVRLTWGSRFYRHDFVDLHLENDWGSGTHIDLPCRMPECTLEQLDAAVLGYFNRYERPLAPCKKCGALSWNREHYPDEGGYRPFCGDCCAGLSNARLVAAQKAADAKQAVQDARAKQQGMKYKTEAWVHPATGDDYRVLTYTRGKPSDIQLTMLLRDSVVKTDYRTTAL